MTTADDEWAGPWCTDQMGCDHCGHEWVDVHPCLENLECPRCGGLTLSAHAREHNEWMSRNLGGEG